MQGTYPVVTLCGSTKFKDQFLDAQKRLTLQGNIVLSVGLFGHSGDAEAYDEATKTMLDDMHKRKIDMADSIFVINVGGYIGASTRSEIAYAHSTGKAVAYLEPEPQPESKPEPQRGPEPQPKEAEPQAGENRGRRETDSLKTERRPYCCRLRRSSTGERNRAESAPRGLI